MTFISLTFEALYPLCCKAYSLHRLQCAELFRKQVLTKVGFCPYSAISVEDVATASRKAPRSSTLHMADYPVYYCTASSEDDTSIKDAVGDPMTPRPQPLLQAATLSSTTGRCSEQVTIQRHQSNQPFDHIYMAN